MKSNILLVHNRCLPIFNKNNQGAIEKLERIYLKHNENGSNIFTVYSPKIAEDDYDSRRMKNVTFRNIDLTTKRSILFRFYYAIKRRILNRGNNEYYIREVIKDIKRRREENKYDLIIFENEEGSIPLFRKKINTNTRIVLHLHNDYVNTDKKYSAVILDNCDEVWCVSKFIESRVLEVKNTNTIVISNTAEKMPPFDPEKVSILKRKYKPEKNAIFLYVGRLLRTKGIAELVEAFNNFNKKHKNAKLIIVGAFGERLEDKLFAKQVNAMVAHNRNITLEGYKDISEIANYYKIAKAQIIPSKWNEAFGLVVIEAMQGGTQIIATDNMAFREICKEKAIYVSRNNLTEGLVEAMEKTLVVADIPKGYYSDILKEFSVENYCASLDNAIMKSIERGINK